MDQIHTIPEKKRQTETEDIMDERETGMLPCCPVHCIFSLPVSISVLFGLFLCLLLPPICVPVPLNTSDKALIPEGLPIQEIIPPLPLPSAQHCFAFRAGYCDPGG